MTLRVKLLSDKLIIAYNLYGTPTAPIETYCHYCPGCKVLHGFAVRQPFDNDAVWTYNEDPMLPTFRPSMKLIGKVNNVNVRCCYKLVNGILDYEKDCTHQFKGQKIPLPGIPYSIIKHAEFVRTQEQQLY